MFGLSTADWIFCGFILLVIFVCVTISDMLKPKPGVNSMRVPRGK